MMIRYLSIAVMLLFTGAVIASNASAQVQFSQPVVSDSRVKTFVYNPNDIYRIFTHYGYQSNLEFGEKERIRTISIGDRVSWQIIPARNRLFIRPLEHGAQTNMTIITNERAYQFDLVSSEDRALRPNDELVYVARFYYPDADTESLSLPVTPSISAAPSAPAASAPILAPTVSEAPALTPPTTAPSVQIARPEAKTLNYNYSYSGIDSLAPRKIYDDGQNTYLKLPLTQGVSVSKVTRSNSPTPIRTYRNAEGLLVVPVVTQELALIYNNNDRITIYNEQ